MTVHEVPEIAPWGKWDKTSLQILFAGGVVVAVLTLVANVIGIVSDLVTGHRLLTLLVDQPLPPEADTGPAVLVDGRFESARVFVSDLSAGANALLTAGSVVLVVSNLLVAAAFLYLVWRLLRREPFKRSLSWTFVTAGAVLLIGSIIGQALTGFGGLMAMEELGASKDNSFWAIMVGFDFAPLGLGFILMLVASAFEYAQKLAVATRGLV